MGIHSRSSIPPFTSRSARNIVFVLSLVVSLFSGNGQAALYCVGTTGVVSMSNYYAGVQAARNLGKACGPYKPTSSFVSCFLGDSGVLRSNNCDADSVALQACFRALGHTDATVTCGGGASNNIVYIKDCTDVLPSMNKMGVAAVLPPTLPPVSPPSSRPTTSSPSTGAPTSSPTNAPTALYCVGDGTTGVVGTRDYNAGVKAASNLGRACGPYKPTSRFVSCFLGDSGVLRSNNCDTDSVALQACFRALGHMDATVTCGAGAHNNIVYIKDCTVVLPSMNKINELMNKEATYEL